MQMISNVRMYRSVLATVFCLSVVSILSVRFWAPEFSGNLMEEDGAVENMSVAFYLTGLVICLSTMRKKKDRLFLAATWAMVCFVCIGEETSWLQRVFDYSVPSVEKISWQSEFNLHNLKPLKHSICQQLFRVGFFGYFLILPLLYRSKRIGRLLGRFSYRSPDAWFALAILIVFALSVGLSVGSGFEMRHNMAETREMLYALYIMLYLMFFLYADIPFRDEPLFPDPQRRPDGQV